MADTPLTKKLLIKPGYKLLILNAPDGYLDRLNPLPDGAKVFTVINDSTFDLVQRFVYSKADVDQNASAAIQALKPGGLLWLTYPKKSSGIDTDISRDAGWDAVQSAGFESVALVSVDDTWSAMRYRPSSDVKARK